MDVTIEEVRARVLELAKKINAPANALSVLDGASSDGSPYVDIRGDEIYLVSSERGIEFSRKKISSLDDLLYLLLRRITHRMAEEFECRNRVNEVDSRRLLFDRWVYYMGEINPLWGDKVKSDIYEILNDAPFRD